MWISSMPRNPPMRHALRGSRMCRSPRSLLLPCVLGVASFLCISCGQSSSSTPSPLVGSSNGTSQESGWLPTPSPWALQRIDGERLELIVALSGDRSCERFSHVEVDETTHTVKLTALVDVRSGVTCADSGRLEPTTVKLSEALKQRKLAGCKIGEGEGRPDFLVRTHCGEIAAEGV